MDFHWTSDGITWKAELPTRSGKIICTVRSKKDHTGYTGLIEHLENSRRAPIAAYTHFDDLDTARTKCEERALAAKETFEEAELGKEEQAPNE